MDWLLTVPLLLIEILLVMKLDGDDFSSRAWTLGFGSALMIVSSYYGDQLVHVPNCVFVPDARLLGSRGSGVYPARILCIRYHFQVRSAPGQVGLWTAP